MNELEQEYQDRIDFIKLDVSSLEGNCEFGKQGFTYIPAMIYRDRNGKETERTDSFREKEYIKQRLDALARQ